MDKPKVLYGVQFNFDRVRYMASRHMSHVENWSSAPCYPFKSLRKAQRWVEYFNDSHGPGSALVVSTQTALSK